MSSSNQKMMSVSDLHKMYIKLSDSFRSHCGGKLEFKMENEMYQAFEEIDMSLKYAHTTIANLTPIEQDVKSEQVSPASNMVHRELGAMTVAYNDMKAKLKQALEAKAKVEALARLQSIELERRLQHVISERCVSKVENELEHAELKDALKWNAQQTENLRTTNDQLERKQKNLIRTLDEEKAEHQAENNALHQELRQAKEEIEKMKDAQKIEAARYRVACDIANSFMDISEKKDSEECSCGEKEVSNTVEKTSDDWVVVESDSE